MQKFTTYLETYQVEWLKHAAITEGGKRGHNVTVAQILREMIDKEIGGSNGKKNDRSERS
jgi:hypothetical protein